MITSVLGEREKARLKRSTTETLRDNKYEAEVAVLQVDEEVVVSVFIFVGNSAVAFPLSSWRNYQSTSETLSTGLWGKSLSF